MKRVTLVPRPKGKRKDLLKYLEKRERKIRKLQKIKESFQTFYTLYTQPQQDEEEKIIQGPLETETFQIPSPLDDLYHSYQSVLEEEPEFSLDDVSAIIEKANAIINKHVSKKKDTAQFIVDDPFVHIFHFFLDTKMGSLIFLLVSCSCFNIPNILFGMFYLFHFLNIWPAFSTFLSPLWLFWLIAFGLIISYNAFGFGFLAFGTMFYNKIKSMILLWIESYENNMDECVARYFGWVNAQRKMEGKCEMFIYEPNYELKKTAEDQLRVYKTPKLHLIAIKPAKKAKKALLHHNHDRESTQPQEQLDPIALSQQLGLTTNSPFLSEEGPFVSDQNTGIVESGINFE